MGALLRDALRRLCVEAGWSYAVFWRVIGGSNPTQLVWEDGHCEKKRSISGFEAMDLLLKEQGLVRNSCNNSFVELECQVEDNLSALVHGMMVHHVHVLGDGIIGRSAFTGDHQWILRESFNGHGSEELSEMNQQFLAGIQTVAVIPVLPYGVVQLGSVQMVMEDTGFVNHVKCLFAHVGRVPGALLAIIQQNLSQKGQILRIPQSDCHSENFCTKMDESLSAASGGSNSQFAKSPVLTSFARSSCSSFVPLHEKMLPTASEVPLIEQIIRGTTMPINHKIVPLTQPVDKSVPHLNNQLEGGNLGVQVLDPNSDLRSIQLGLPYGSNSEVEGQSSRMTTGLPSHISRFLEKELSVSVSRSENPTNLSEPTLNDAKTNQISHQCVFSGSLQDLDISPLFGKFESLSNTNDVGSLSTPPGGTTEAISITCSTLLSNQTNHLNGCEVISNASCLSIPSNKSSESILNAWKQGNRNDLVKDIDNLSAKSDVHGSCYGSLSGFSQDRRLSHEVSSLTNIQDEKVSSFFSQPTSQNDLFDIVGLDIRKEHFHGSLHSMLVQGGIANGHTLAADISTCNTQLDVGPVVDSVDYDMSCSTVFSETVPDQLLDAVVSKVSSVVKQGTDESVSCRTLTTKIGSSSAHGSPAYVKVVPCQHKEGESLDLSPVLLKTEAAGPTLKTEDCLQGSGGYKSQISLWVEDGQNMRSNNIPAVPCKRVDETNKLNRKRARPGESPRPRPKDRQMIQDRVKELREIVPNGAKLSIDALLEKTIKHMLFLQSVTKHADKLKKTGEPKIISKDGGVLLKDNFEGGATWAFEVGSQSMICPIIVEDLNPPRQMLVEMLCEERGFFLEIADLIRGLGLTILRGVMEARKDKVWARFAVEANRDVTRMEIFLSLVRLLEPTAVSGLKPQGLESSMMPHLFHHSSIPATGSS